MEMELDIHLRDKNELAIFNCNTAFSCWTASTGFLGNCRDPVPNIIICHSRL
ncbi:hypothetical protein Mapa_007579 [Marchantia paleacea]|nr:hypothetical protein Mapa_007579 [Marchantia paleacea]